MPSVIANEDGTQTIVEEDAPEVIQDAPQRDGVAEAPTSTPQDATDAFLASLMQQNDSENVEAVQVLVGDTLLDFGIKYLSERETFALLRKRLRNSGGRLVPMADASLILKSQALIQCVKRNAGTPEAPMWVPRWTEEDVLGNQQQKGLIDNPSEAARELRDGLWQEVFARNEAIDPLRLAVQDQAVEAAILRQLNA